MSADLFKDLRKEFGEDGLEIVDEVESLVRGGSEPSSHGGDEHGGASTAGARTAGGCSQVLRDGGYRVAPPGLQRLQGVPRRHSRPTTPPLFFFIVRELIH